MLFFIEKSAVDQSFTVPSQLAEMSVEPSGVKARPATGP